MSSGTAARQSPVRLLAIGDIAWDILVRPTGDLVWGSDAFGTVDLLPGGSSANVAVWARRLGARVALVGAIGDDRLGDLMHAHLDAEGVASHVARIPGGATMRIAIVIRPDGERSFITDHAHPLVLTAAHLPATLLDEADVVFLNGYSIFMARGVDFAAPLLAEARQRAIPIAFDPSSFALIARYGRDRLLEQLGPIDVLLGNEEELGALAGSAPVESLLDRARLVVIKKGARGAAAVSRGGHGASPERCSEAAVRVEAVDTTGAGDAFDAAFLVDYFTHGRLEVALTAANLLGARVASRVGAQRHE
jgi:ribokinase